MHCPSHCATSRRRDFTLIGVRPPLFCWSWSCLASLRVTWLRCWMTRRRQRLSLRSLSRTRSKKDWALSCLAFASLTLTARASGRQTLSIGRWSQQRILGMGLNTSKKTPHTSWSSAKITMRKILRMWSILLEPIMKGQIWTRLSALKHYCLTSYLERSSKSFTAPRS